MESIIEVLSSTPEVGLAVAEKERRSVHELQAELATIPKGGLVIRSAEDYAAVSERLARKIRIKDQLFAILDPVRKALWDALQLTRKQHALILDPIEVYIAADKAALLVWRREQERIAAEKQREAQRQAEAEAAEQRRRESEELRLRIAEQLAEIGDEEAAEAALVDETIQAAPMPVFVPRVVADVPVVAGQSMVKNWQAEIVNFEDLVMDVAEGIKSMRSSNTLAGHAPVTVLEANQTKLNQMAKASESMLRIPGVVAVNRPYLTQRRKKGE